MIYVGVARGEHSALGTTLNIIQHSEIQYILGLYRGLNMLSRRSRMLT